MSNASESKLKLVPEALLKRKHSLEDRKSRRQAKEELKLVVPRRKVNKKKNSVKVIHPQRILRMALSKRNMRKRFHRVNTKGMGKHASKNRIYKVMKVKDENDEKEIDFKHTINSVEAKIVFAFRVRNNFGIPFKIKQSLGVLGLGKLHQGVFVKLTPANQKRLHLTAPYIIYGVPSKATITDLIKRRGHANIKGERVPLSNNTIVEEALASDTGIICIEDLIHQIYTGGDNFDRVLSFLWPFQLSSPSSKFDKRILGMTDTREYGDKGGLIEDIIKLIL